MKKTFWFLSFFILSLYFVISTDVNAQWVPNTAVDKGRLVIRPRLIDDVLINPGIGFTTFQRFNGDTLTMLNNKQSWNDCGPIVYQRYEGSLTNLDYPQTSTAYWRVYWRTMEPTKGNYRWDLLTQALDSAKRRGQRLVFRVAPYGQMSNGVYSPGNDVPTWYRTLVGAYKPNPTYYDWVVDPNDEIYAEHFGAFIRALGKKYDGHPGLEAIDLSIVGPWGEGAGSDLLSNKARMALVDCYAESFKKTRLLALLTDNKTNTYAFDNANSGLRVDCVGDLGQGPLTGPTCKWCHMFDYYPEKFAIPKMLDVWKTAPVHFEICYTFFAWKDKLGYGIPELEYTIEQSLKWHISVFNAKSSPVPPEWMPLIEGWLKKMGYRFALRSLKTDLEVKKGQSLKFESWWENRGVAPIYDENFKLFFRLSDGNFNIAVHGTNADLTKWLPGDNYFNDEIFVPLNIPVGSYTLQVGIVDQRTNLPAIQLGNDGKQPDGWYSLGFVQVKEAPIVRFVNSNGTGASPSNAKSWETASPSLQTVINASAPDDEIWVTAGTYMPEAGKSFALLEGRRIYGGFNGTETSLSQRNCKTNVTIFKGNGKSVFRNSATAGSPITSKTVLDGFTITGGSDASLGAEAGGGGMWNSYASPTITNCVFVANTARIQGAGLCNTNVSNPVINNCSFVDNSTISHSGGAVFNGMGSSPIFTNCSFSGNKSPNNGGAVYNYNGYGKKGYPQFINCLFNGNEVETGGGAMLNGAGAESGSQTVTTITNCTFYGNKATAPNTGTGGAVLSGLGSGVCEVKVFNSVLIGNTAAVSPNIGKSSTGTYVAQYSLIEGMDADVNYKYSANHNIIFGANVAADLFKDIEAEDFSAKTSSITVNAGLNILNEEALDLAGNPRIFEATIDLGAYELQVPKGPSKVNVPKVQLAIYPNPVSNILKIEGLEIMGQVIITDIAGRVVMNTQIVTDEINISELTNGFYSIRLEDNSGIRSAKFLKK